MSMMTFSATAKNLPDGLMVETDSRGFKVILDEPKVLGGTDQGMNPVELLLAAFGACQAIVARVYAPKFEIDLLDYRIELEGDLDTDGFMDVSDVRPGFQEIRYKIYVAANITEEKAEAFVKFVEAHCPVGDSLAYPVKLESAGVVLERTIVNR